MLFPAVKELLKSVKISQSYHPSLAAHFFLRHSIEYRWGGNVTSLNSVASSAVFPSDWAIFRLIGWEIFGSCRLRFFWEAFRPICRFWATAVFQWVTVVQYHLILWYSDTEWLFSCVSPCSAQSNKPQLPVTVHISFKHPYTSSKTRSGLTITQQKG